MYTTETYKNFCNILTQCLLNDIAIELKGMAYNGQVNKFSLDGFSKSGTAIVNYDNDRDQIDVTTRYNGLDHITTYDDLVNIAWSWYIAGVERGYTIPTNFVKDFIRLGYIEERIKTEYVIKD